MGKEFNVSVTCASGVEKALKSELKRLSFPLAPAENGAVQFSTDLNGLLKCNTFLRTAERVYLVLKKFHAETFDEIFDGVKSIDWKSYIFKDSKITVNGKCVKSKIFAVSACQKIIDKAVTQKLMEGYGLKILPESGKEVEINFYLFKDECEIRINTSGVGLHKRGYRDLVGIAPIKETLASAMILMSDYYYERPFADPFCGSGTFLIESAMIGLNIAPNLKRHFALENLKIFDERELKRVREEALDLEKRDRKLEIFGSDIDKKAVDLSIRHLGNAGLSDYVKVSRSDVKDFYSGIREGTIVTNPPYGERVYDKEDALNCYKSLRQSFDKLDSWSLFLITSYKGFEKAFGKKADRTRKLYNSERECNFYYYYGQKGEKND